MPRTPRQLELSSSHQLSGYYYNRNGELESICIKNLDTGEQQKFGLHWPDNDRILIVAPPFSVQSSLRLSHLSGNEDHYNWTVCFHI